MARSDRTTSTVKGRPLGRTELARIDAWWRAANYLSVGQIYLMDNPLLREPLLPEHVKPRLLGHWGTTPGLNFVYAHLNRAISARDLHMMYVIGPGHGGPGLVASAWLEGTYSEIYPDIGLDHDGMRRLFQQFSFPGGIPSHVAPETPGSIHEGGELGYSLSHAYGAAFDNPDLVVAADRRRRRGGDRPARDQLALATSSSTRDGTARCCRSCTSTATRSRTRPSWPGSPSEELAALLRGYGHTPYVVQGVRPARDAPGLRRHPGPLPGRDPRDPAGGARLRRTHGRAPSVADDRAALPQGLDRARRRSTASASRAPGAPTRCRSPTHAATTCHRAVLEQWLRSYRPEELFDDDGAPVRDIADLHPVGRPPDERQPARQRRAAAARPADARLPRLRRRRSRTPAPARSSRPGCSARSCAT